MTKFNKLFLMTMFLATIGIGACGNTVDGVGRDISSAGDWIQEKF